MDSPETRKTLGTQVTGRKKKRTSTQRTKKDEHHGTHQNPKGDEPR